MSGGMRIDPKELPLPMREQLAIKILAQIPAPNPVAGREKKPVKVSVWRLVFPCQGAASRYRELRQKVRDGKLMHAFAVIHDGLVVALCYRRWGETVDTEEPIDIWR